MHDVFGKVHVMDTVRIARRQFGRGGNGLQRLAPRLGIQPIIAHRALADAQTTAAVFDRLLDPVGGWDLCLCDAIAQQGGAMTLAPISSRETLLPLELEEALDARKPVMLEYLDGRDRRTQRVIDPVQVKRFKGELILVAHCHLRSDRRTFKLERIVQLTRIEPGAPISPDPTRSPEPDVLASQHETNLFPSALPGQIEPNRATRHPDSPTTPASEPPGEDPDPARTVHEPQESTRMGGMQLAADERGCEHS
jgi:WYL domain/Exonuclease